MAAMVVAKVAIQVGATISVGCAEPAFRRMAITVAGISVSPDVFKARNVIIERLASGFLPFSSCSCSIALMPSGVAAFPSEHIGNHIGEDVADCRMVVRHIRKQFFDHRPEQAGKFRKEA